MLALIVLEIDQYGLSQSMSECRGRRTLRTIDCPTHNLNGFVLEPKEKLIHDFRTHARRFFRLFGNCGSQHYRFPMPCDQGTRYIERL
jgi:hypothetical protein